MAGFLNRDGILHIWEGLGWSFELLLSASCEVLSESLRPRGMLHARLPCPPTISFFPLGVLAAFSPKLLSLITLLTCPDTKDGWRFHTHSGSYQTRIPTSDVLRMESQIFRVSEHSCTFKWGSLVAQLGKKSPAKQETLVRFLGQLDPLEEEMATHSSALE